MWRVINLFFKDQPSTVNYITVDGKKITSNSDIASAFNQYFNSVIPLLLCDIYGFVPYSSDFSSILSTSNLSLFTFSITPCLSVDIVRYFSYFKKSRIDNHFISHQVFNIFPEFFATQIASYINHCFASNTFPDFLKISEIIPVFKKGNRHLCSNYRPISLLPTLSKIIEKVVAKQIEDYLHSHNLLSNSQFGFQSKNSTESAVLMFLTKVFSHINKNHTVIAIFLDYSKAFDTISHFLLI